MWTEIKKKGLSIIIDEDDRESLQVKLYLSHNLENVYKPRKKYFIYNYIKLYKNLYNFI